MGSGAWDVEITPDGRYAYVMLAWGGYYPYTPYVLKIDLTLCSVVDTIMVHGEGIDLTPDAAELWVSGHARPYVYVISTALDSLIDSVGVPGWGAQVKIAPDGQFAYVSLGLDSALAVVSVPERSLKSKMPTGRAPNFLALSPDGLRIFVSNWQSDCITEYTRTAICAMSHEPGPLRGDIDCDGIINLTDIIKLINYVLRGFPLPPCP